MSSRLAIVLALFIVAAIAVPTKAQVDGVVDGTSEIGTKDTGLILGNPYTPTLIAKFDPANPDGFNAGFNLLSGQYLENGLPAVVGGWGTVAWTPVFRTTGNPQPAISYTVQRGYYYRSGNVVTFSIAVAWNSVTGATNSPLVMDVPFRSNMLTGMYWPAVTSHGFNFLALHKAFLFEMDNNGLIGWLYTTAGPDGAAFGSINGTAMRPSGDLYVEGWLVSNP